MRVACSLILSAMLAFPSALFSAPQDAAQNKDAAQDAAQDKDTKPAAPAASAPAPVVKEPLAFGLEDATPVRMRINRTVSSGDAQVNDTVDFEVLDDVKVKDAIVIARGGMAWGTVTEAQPKRRMGRGGKLNINIDNVKLVSGEKVALRAIKDVKGGGHQGAITGAIVATSIVFFPAAPLFLLVHGKDITIPKGTEITAYINGDIPLDQKKCATQTTVRPEAGSTTVQPTTDVAPTQNGNGSDAVLSTVEIKPTPAGAEITVDEKFMGSTPSSLRLAAGGHKIKLEKSGFKTWERTLTVGAGATATVDPTLEKQE